MNTFFRKVSIVFTDKAIRTKILFVLAGLAVFRLLAVIPIPGVDPSRVASLLSENQFFNFFNLLSGGGLANISIVMLGVGPYITASIVMQLGGVLIPRLKEMMQDEGEIGRRKFTQYSRILTVPFAILQAVGFLALLGQQGVIDPMSRMELIRNVAIITSGSVLLMWIGELITEFGIGNGVSLIIFAGIVSTLPAQIARYLFTFTNDQLLITILLIVVFLLVIAVSVFVSEAERRVPVTYSRQTRSFGSANLGTSTYIPLRLTQAGVMPIIFASSLLLAPRFIQAFIQGSTNANLITLNTWITRFLEATWIYSLVYFLLVVFFTYFYTSINFDPKKLSSNIQKNGGFIPGTRPGEATESYIDGIVTRITLVGAVFLGVIAVLPFVLQGATGVATFAIGGTSLLIVISVITELYRKLDAQIAMHEY